MNPNLILEIIRIFFLGQTREPEEDYDVDPFIEELKEFKESQKQIFYKISKDLDTGMIVRALGINGFISYNHMPWKYNKFDYWRIMAPYLKHEQFVGIIYAIAHYTPPFIILDGKSHKININVEFKKDKAYKAVVLSKKDNLVKFELGHGLNWEYGSIIETQHKDNFTKISNFNSIKIGDEISVTFRGQTFNTTLFSDHKVDSGWLNGEIEALIGTEQKFKITRDNNGRSEFWLNDRYKGIIPINKTLYPNHNLLLEIYLSNLANGEEITCKIQRPYPYRHVLRLKFTSEFLLTINARDHRIPKKLLISGKSYTARILRKSNIHIELDLGGHFNWKYGSIFAIQHRTAFKTPNEFTECKKEEHIEAVFLEYLSNGIAVCGEYFMDNAWYDCTWLNQTGEIVKLEVTKRKNKQPILLVGRYEASIQLLEKKYRSSLIHIQNALIKLKNGSQLIGTIAQYYPESKKLKVQLTDEQIDILLENENHPPSRVARRFDPIPHHANMRQYTIVENNRSTVILELEVEVFGDEIKEGVEVKSGPYSPAFKIWTCKASPQKIAEEFLYYQTEINHPVIHIGLESNEYKLTRLEQKQLIQQQSFLNLLADKVKAYLPDMQLTKEEEYTITRNNQFNINYSKSNPLNFKNVRWWDHPSYDSHRFIFVQMSHKAGGPIWITIDHQKLLVSPNVISIEPVLDACWETLQKLLDEHC